MFIGCSGKQSQLLPRAHNCYHGSGWEAAPLFSSILGPVFSCKYLPGSAVPPANFASPIAKENTNGSSLFDV